MAKTFRNKNKKNATRRNISSNRSSFSSFQKEITVVFLEMLLMIKLYHWKTYSYATHKATDDLYSKLNENIDHFIEVLLGKCGNRISLEHVKHISLKDFNHENQIMREMEDFKSFLVGCDTQLKQMGGMTNTDLLNIRDEMLGNVNQFLYLMTFK
jgi:DNA-binding ferritin-like protein